MTEPVLIDHRDRFRWAAYVRAIPKDKLSAAAKVILLVIGEAVDAKSGRAIRSHEQIAKAAGGYDERTVRNAIAAGEALNLIAVDNRGGGIVYDEQGVGHGRVSHYQMAVEPGTALPGWVTDTRNVGSTYPEPNADLPGKKVPPTRKEDSYNPLSYPSSNPPLSLGLEAKPKESDSGPPSVSLGKEEAMRASPWPIATHSELAASRIPINKARDRDKVILQEGTDTADELVRRIGWLLGYSAKADDMGGDAIRAEIASLLTRDAWPDRIAALKAGTVTFATLANWAAHHGFMAIEESKSEAA